MVSPGTILRFTSGDPSVEAIAIPPWFAVLSFGLKVVPIPNTISASTIWSCSVFSWVTVPPKEILLLTYKSPRTVSAFVVAILSLLIVPVIILAASERYVAVVAVPADVAIPAVCAYVEIPAVEAYVLIPDVCA